MEKNAVNDMFVILSDVWLDNAEVCSSIRGLIRSSPSIKSRILNAHVLVGSSLYCVYTNLYKCGCPLSLSQKAVRHIVNDKNREFKTSLLMTKSVRQ